MRVTTGFLLATALGFLPTRAVSAQTVDVRVDPRIELLATVFRLAGRQEYNRTRVPRWAAAVDSQFAPLVEHPAVAMSRRLGFGFFIPMNLAVHLTPPPALAERTPFAVSASLHRRWTTYPDSTRAYLDLLRAFARDARFTAFLAAQQPLIDSAEARLGRIVTMVDRQWIDGFWGTAPVGDLILAPGLTNGTASYGQAYRPESGHPEAYAIIGVRRTDSRGFPLFDASDLPTVLHEIQHPYVTPLIQGHADDFRSFGDSLYATVAASMRAQAYGTWDAMLNEALVRAALPRYFLAHGDSAAAERTIREETAAGFVWTRGLVDLLGRYELERATYPSMAAFMPEVVAFFRDLLR